MKLVEALERNFENREVKSGPTMSGNIYVTGLTRADPKGDLVKIVVSTVARCGHQNRICLACAHTWGWDHQLFFDRTNGGRALAEKLEKAGLDVVAIANGKGRKPSPDIED